jgi:lysozyme
MTIEEVLMRDEGIVLHAYQDSLGYWTIGIGRLIDQRKGGGISTEEALYLLHNDIKKVEKQLDDHLPWWRMLSENRQIVLISMCFNLGINGLLQFKKTLDLIERGLYIAAAEAMLQSKWATQVGQRANRLAKMMEEDS